MEEKEVEEEEGEAVDGGRKSADRILYWHGEREEMIDRVNR